MTQPTAYRHGLQIEPHDNWRYEYTESAESPFGERGKDYDPDARYKCEPLWLNDDSRDRAKRLMEQVMETWDPPKTTGGERKADIAQTAVMLTIAYIMGREFIPDELNDNQRAAIDDGLKLLINELDNKQPTMAEWMDGWEVAVQDGMSRISREEAERRYYQTYGRAGRPNGEG